MHQQPCEKMFKYEVKTREIRNATTYPRLRVNRLRNPDSRARREPLCGNYTSDR